MIGILAHSNSARAEHPYVPGEVIVKLRGVSGTNKVLSQSSTHAFFSRATSRHNLRLIHSWEGMNLHHMKLDAASNESVSDVVADLSQMSEVEYAEPNYIVQKQSIGDVSAEATYTLSQVQQFMGNNYVMTQANIQAKAAWSALNSSGSKVVVAVIDTGIDFNHGSFANAIWTNPGEVPGNGIDDDGNGYVDDVHGWNFAYGNNSPQDDEGHGTHVSGIVLGTGQNIFQNPAPSTDVVIMPLKFLDSSGSGSTASAISAIYYAANMGARVMNNSWGGGDYSLALAEAITYAYSKDILFVAAAGNSSTNIDASPSYPASYNMPNVVAVAASDSSDVIAYFSNYGRVTVPLSAPGVSILSTYLGGNFQTMSGTSMASPFVAGVAALMRFQNPAMNSYQIKQLLLSSTDRINDLTSYVATSGRVNVLNSVNAAANTPVDPYLPNYALTIEGDRDIASSLSTRGGCGLVSVIGKDFNGRGGPQNRLRQVALILALLLLPIVIVFSLRRPESRPYRRKFDRYAINSTVTFKVGEQELVGAVKTISLGGTDLNTEALLKDGSVITMTISSPDGQSKIDVQGHIVWSEQHKRYGVAFDTVTDGIKAQITQWTKALNKV